MNTEEQIDWLVVMDKSYDKDDFDDFDSKNPEIWKMFLHFARQARRVRNHYSARSIIERMRWETMVRGNDEFKINNNWAPFYARKLIAMFPIEFAGFFEIRTKKNGKHDQ